MRKQKWIILLFTLLLSTVVGCIWVYSKFENQQVELSVLVESKNGSEIIHCWKNDQDEYFAFLPSYADVSKVKIQKNTDNNVRIDGVPVTDTERCNNFQLDVPYSLEYTAWGKKCLRTLTFVKSANVATMYIDTKSGNMDYIHLNKGNEETGELRLVTSDGTLDYAGDLESINGRGNYTWDTFDKKPYSISLSKEADLLGMGLAQKWILLANADDSSNLRNKLVYEFADQIGLAYSPDSQWVDLYLNGEYVGLYQLCERNEAHANRVDVTGENSFLVSLERSDRLKAQNYPYVNTAAEQYLRVHHPSNPSAETLASIRATWQSVENAILAEDGIDPVTGVSWLELIDLDSWARKYLIEEVFGNGDACYISQYFYFDGNDSSAKIYAGPVWDYDHVMGSVSAWELLNPQSMYANRLHVKDGFDTPWFYNLYQKEEFYERVTELYQTEFLPALEQLLEQDLNKYATEITQADRINRIRWSVENDILFDANYIHDFMLERIKFLSSNWIDGTEYYYVKADQGFGGFYGYFAVLPGECLSSIYQFENTESSTFLGWYYTDTDEPFDITRPITENIEIYAKWEDSASNKIDKLWKLMPLGIIAVLFVAVFWVGIKRIRSERATKDDRT